MTTIEITKDNFEPTILDNDIVFLDFWAAWCGPCRFFAPIFEQAAKDNPDIVFGKIDTEVQREIAAAFSISSIPTLMAIRDRTVLFSEPGALPAAALADLVAQVRTVDMQAVAPSRSESAV